MSDEQFQKEKILNLIPPDDLKRVEANPKLNRIKDDAIAWENVAQALIDETRVGSTKAQLKLRSAEEEATGKQEALEEARSEAIVQHTQYQTFWAQYCSLSSRYEDWQRHYEGIDQKQHTTVGLAQFQALQAEGIYNWAQAEFNRAEKDSKQAWEIVKTCRAETDAREHFGKLVSQTVRVDLFPRSTIAWEKIEAVLDGQDNAMDGGTS